MSNLDAKLQLVHLRNAYDVDVKVRVEVAVISRVQNESYHLLLEQVDIFKGGIEGAEHGYLLSHGLASSDVLDPECVQDNVGNL